MIRLSDYEKVKVTTIRAKTSIMYYLNTYHLICHTPKYMYLSFSNHKTGLTIGSDLCSCQAESVLESDLIVTLLYVQRRSDGHWVTPHRDLPLVLNDEALETSMLLSNGEEVFGI